MTGGACGRGSLLLYTERRARRLTIVYDKLSNKNLYVDSAHANEPIVIEEFTLEEVRDDRADIALWSPITRTTITTISYTPPQPTNTGLCQPEGA